MPFESRHAISFGRTLAVSLVLMLVAACGGGAPATTSPAGKPRRTASLRLGALPRRRNVSLAGPRPDIRGCPVRHARGLLDRAGRPRRADVPLINDTRPAHGVDFKESYGASGDQSRAVEAGLQADFVEFSLAPDMDRLVKAQHRRRRLGNAGQYKGFVTDSVVTFVVRPGNPKGIKTWDDLIKDGVGVIEPNPFTSGGARWNVMAAYGAMIKQGKSEADAVAYLTSLFQHVLVQDKAAREALQTFIAGQGDVMLAYENEAIAAQQGGQTSTTSCPTRRSSSRTRRQ